MDLSYRLLDAALIAVVEEASVKSHYSFEL